jgi:microcystin degradation protein MlrC
MLVVADGDVAAAQALADKLGREFYEQRDEVSLKPIPMKEALDYALSRTGSGRPVVVADMADNPGGGAPSDSTFVLRELLERKVRNAAIALFWDPIAVQLAFGAGEGATLTLRLGGKMGPMSGDPLDLTVTVNGLKTDLVQRFPQITGYIEAPVGAGACLTCEGIDIIVGSDRHQVFGTELFTEFGVEPADRDLLVVKSSNHFRAAYAPIASEIVYMSAPGALGFDFGSMPYKRLDKNKYPIVDDPWVM